MKTLATIVNWLCDDHSYRFFEGSGFALVFICAVVIGMIVVCSSKKLRKVFF